MRIAVTGVSGRMGRMLVETIDAAEGVTLAGATERSGHDWIGRDLGEMLRQAPRGLIVSDDPSAALSEADVAIDFTAPAATLAHVEAAAKTGCAMVIGTTGFSDGDVQTLTGFGERVTMVRAGNMSLGVNLLTRLVRQVAATLGQEFDIEVVEAHHRAKADAPSGTALMLGTAAADGRGVSLDAVADRGRDGITGARRAGDIGFAAIRGGSIIGTHEVIFAGEGETITLGHVANDRSLFARGALAAARWTEGRPPGAYDMLDVLGID